MLNSYFHIPWEVLSNLSIYRHKALHYIYLSLQQINYSNLSFYILTALRFYFSLYMTVLQTTTSKCRHFINRDENTQCHFLNMTEGPKRNNLAKYIIKFRLIKKKAAQNFPKRNERIAIFQCFEKSRAMYRRVLCKLWV